MLRFIERRAVGGIFDADDVRILSDAFDEAWTTVQRSGVSFGQDPQAEATRELLALRIIEMAQLGERDKNRLRDDAIQYLARTNLQSTGL